MTVKHLLNLTSDTLRTLPMLILYLTDGCNSRCVTCDIWRNPRRNMRMERVEALAAQIRPLGVRWVVLSGGEAMQHPAWAAIARKLRAEGARVILLTNGLFLKKQADDVIASVDEVVVSLDGGTAATYAAIRGVDAFDLVLYGIRAVRAGGIDVTTRTVVQRANYRELPAIIDAAKSADVNHISFLTVDVSNREAFGARFEGQPHSPARTGEAGVIPLSLIGQGDDLSVPRPVMEMEAGGEANDVHQAIPVSALTPDDLPAFAAVLDELERRCAHDFATGRIAESPAKLRRMHAYFAAVLGLGAYPTVRCNAPHLSAVVEVDGSLRPCYFLPKMGKLNGASLNEAINAPDALALRAAYRNGERGECGTCVCPLYKGARALLRM
ncbi:MAG: radical SAM protein [Chloroflexota bacterium]|nr:radical SAM protein [Chloroflexota bacterium]